MWVPLAGALTMKVSKSGWNCTLFVLGSGTWRLLVLLKQSRVSPDGGTLGGPLGTTVSLVRVDLSCQLRHVNFVDHETSA